MIIDEHEYIPEDAGDDFAYAVSPGPRALGLEALLRGLEVRGETAGHWGGSSPVGADRAGSGSTTAAGSPGAANATLPLVVVVREGLLRILGASRLQWQ